MDTEYVPEIKEASIENNKVRVVITSPLVYNRSIEVLIGGSHNSYCVYPGESWKHAIEDCQDVFILETDWDSISHCNWREEENDEYYKWRTNFVVMVMEDLGETNNAYLSR